MPNTTSRLDLQEPLTSDAFTELRTAITNNATTLDAAVIYETGTISARASLTGLVAGTVYYATDTAEWSIYNGTGWGSIPTLMNSAGATNIATSQSTSSTSFTTLSTPDEVTGVVLPSNGLLAVWYQATWSNTVGGAGNAAIFLGSNQVQQATPSGPSAVVASIGSSITTAVPLSSASDAGLLSTSSGGGYSGDVTTGQMVGLYSGTGNHGGPCYVFAAAGTYTISIQFKASSGSVTVVNRKLWVQVLPFA